MGSVFGYEIVGEYLHDTEAYTLGLIYGWIDLPGPETADPAAILRASVSGLEWDCLRRCGPQAVCNGQTLAKGLSNSSEAAATWNSVILLVPPQGFEPRTNRL